ncbi:MAG: hypothetical protein C5B53_00145 [Candidatus Melainabacteria bacterium]|nr:MAG: hypothetical protein C5B53_00145 [Candidatus Melainabacteria bacterium]
MSFFFCWLLSLAYPQGLATEETWTYWQLKKNFHWFEPNQLDFFRTIPYSALLGASCRFANPTGALYWLNGVMFSLDIAVVFILGRLLFSSRVAAILLAVFSLAFEVTSMHIFYFNLQLCPDPLYAELVFLASNISLIAWLKKQPYLLLFASCILGFSAFLKPAGAVICVLWLTFIIIVLFRQSVQAQKTFALIAICSFLGLGPFAFWCLRNFCIYGYPTCIGRTGGSFLETVLPIRTNDEHFFGNPKVDAEFHIAVIECERGCQPYVQPDELQNESLSRYFRYDRYFLYGPATINPFSFLGKLKIPNWEGMGFHEIFSLEPEQMFTLDAEAGRVASIIIRDHPVGYLKLLFREYCEMFQPMLMWTNPLYSYQNEPAKAYDYWDTARQGPRPKYFDLYPHIGGLPSGKDSNLFVARALGALHENPVVQMMLNCYYACELYLSHFIFVGACIIGILVSRNPTKFADPERIYRIAVVLVMLFLTAAANSFFVATCNIAKLRYQIAGELELHLAFLVTLFVLVRLCLAMLEKMARGRVSKLAAEETG